MSPSTSATPTSLIGQIQAQQALLALTDHDLCAALGFEREIVLTMIKAGNMKLPLNKVPALAVALELDAAELLKVALRETSPDLLQVIEEVFNTASLTATEMNLIRHLRELCGNTPASPLVFGGKGVIALVAV